MPEEYVSIFDPTQSGGMKAQHPAPPRHSPQQVCQQPPQQIPYCSPQQPPQVIQQVPQQVPQQVHQQVPQQIPQQVPQAPRPVAPDNVFGLFNETEEKKALEVPQMAGPAPSKDDTVSKLNEIMRKIQQKEEEDQKKKEEETKRVAAMQAQFATGCGAYGMNSIMNPYMTRMNMYYGNPYMTGAPDMQRPVAPGSVPYQVNLG